MFFKMAIILLLHGSVKAIDEIASPFFEIDPMYCTIIEEFFTTIADKRKVREPAYDMACFEALLTMNGGYAQSPCKYCSCIPAKISRYSKYEYIFLFQFQRIKTRPDRSSPIRTRPPTICPRPCSELASTRPR
jgi:hypothetical protein